MGLATIDSHSQKELTEIHKIPKFGVNQASFDWDTAIWKCQNLQRSVWHYGRCPTRRPDAIHFFVNFDVLNRCLSVKTNPIILVANPIIYRLVPGPSRFEIRQCFSQSKQTLSDCLWKRGVNVISDDWVSSQSQQKLCWRHDGETRGVGWDLSQSSTSSFL